jgi:iron only hydrogenase large subunit-like protein
MENLSQEGEELVKLFDKKEKLVAMLAPSFPVVFKYPQIVGMVKRLGFKYVVEVARGAEETNKQLLALMEEHPDKRYIANPCPTIVRLIRSKYPHLVEYLAPIDSPMTATAKIVAKEYPGYKKVFIGPCLLKKLEANEDHPELGILAITFKDLQEVLKAKNVKPSFFDRFSSFDISAQETRLYPISGGLSQSSEIIKKLTDPEYDVISGSALANKVLQEFVNKPQLKVLDILNCDGGCINGPGIVSKDSLDRRRKKIIAYWGKGS